MSAPARARLTVHQAEVLGRLERLARWCEGGWVRGSTIGSAGALGHLVRKGYAERLTEIGPRGGEHHRYRPVAP